MSNFIFQVEKIYKRSAIKEAIGLDPTAKGGPWGDKPMTQKPC